MFYKFLSFFYGVDIAPLISYDSQLNLKLFVHRHLVTVLGHGISTQNLFVRA